MPTFPSHIPAPPSHGAAVRGRLCLSPASLCRALLPTPAPARAEPGERAVGVLVMSFGRVPCPGCLLGPLCHRPVLTPCDQAAGGGHGHQGTPAPPAFPWLPPRVTSQLLFVSWCLYLLPAPRCPPGRPWGAGGSWLSRKTPRSGGVPMGKVPTPVPRSARSWLPSPRRKS